MACERCHAPLNYHTQPFREHVLGTAHGNEKLLEKQERTGQFSIFLCGPCERAVVMEWFLAQ